MSSRMATSCYSGSMSESCRSRIRRTGTLRIGELVRQAFLALLIVLLPGPAVSMPIANQTHMESAKGHCDEGMAETDKDDQLAIPHGCIGCLAPFDSPTVISRPPLWAATKHVTQITTQRPFPKGAPEPPPPRN